MGADSPGESLPPTSALLDLLGAPLLLEALRTTNLHRKVLLGFRETPHVFRNLVVQKRLEEALNHPGALDKLGRVWKAAAPAAYSQIETLLDEPGSGTSLPVVQHYGPDAVRWGLILIGRPETKDLLERWPSLLENNSTPSLAATAQSPSMVRGMAKQADRDEHPFQTLDTGHDAREPEQIAEQDIEEPSPTQAAMQAKSQAEDLLKKSHQCVEGLEKSLREERRERAEAQAHLQATHREAMELRKKVEEARKGAEEWQRRAKTAENEARSSLRQAERLQRLLDEMTSRLNASERREKKLQESQNIAVQAVIKPPEVERDSAGAVRSLAASHSPGGNPLTESVESVFKRLMEKRRFTAVADHARELWERDRSNTAAFRWLVDALQGGGQQEEAARLYYEAGTQALAEGRHGNAVEAFAQSIRCAPESPDAAWRIEKLLQTAEPSSREDLEMVARLYGELRRQSFEASSTFETLARRLRRSLWRRLPALMTEEHKRVAVTWTNRGRSAELSASELAASVAAGDVDLVDQFRRWAASQGGELRQAALQVIEGAHAFLPGARRVLTGPTRRILVDGSNVAWSGQMSNEGPDLDNIRALRHKLFNEGYFPVVILADAALPYQVKEQERLNRWLLRGEIHLVEGRTDADETLLQEARRWDCPIVTNDLMRDLDPDGSIPRIGFVIGPGGVDLKDGG